MNREMQKEVKRIALKAGADKVIMRRDGTVTASRHYFYRMGLSGKRFAERIEKALGEAGYVASVEGRDEWRAWPKDSNFVAEIHSCEPEANHEKAEQLREKAEQLRTRDRHILADGFENRANEIENNAIFTNSQERYAQHLKSYASNMRSAHNWTTKRRSWPENFRDTMRQFHLKAARYALIYARIERDSTYYEMPY